MLDVLATSRQLEEAAHLIAKARAAINTPEAATAKHAREMLAIVLSYEPDQDPALSLEERAYRRILQLKAELLRANSHVSQ